MKKLIVTGQDKWIITVSDEEYESLKYGDTDITELLEERQINYELIWKNAFSDYDVIGE